MNIDFWILDWIDGLSQNVNIISETFLLGSYKSRSEVNLSWKFLKDLSMSLLSMRNAWSQSIGKLFWSNVVQFLSYILDVELVELRKILEGIKNWFKWSDADGVRLSMIMLEIFHLKIYCLLEF